jgi:small ligand-binding sensory domain FIST
MIERVPVARAALVAGQVWRALVRQAFDETKLDDPDLTFLFASADFVDDLPELLAESRRLSNAPLLVGCSASGLIGPGQELEGQPAIAVLQASLPDAKLNVVRFDQFLIEREFNNGSLLPLGDDPDDFSEHPAAPPFGVDSADVNGWLVFADPFQTDCDRLIASLAGQYPGVPVLGGLASADPFVRRTFVFVNDQLYADGGVGLAIGGPYALAPLVSQGCQPIGEAWTITGAHDNWVETISNRPAVQVMADSLQTLPDEDRERAQRNLVVGLAADEYRQDFSRGDFLIRNLVGFDSESGALALAGLPRAGQTIQFQVRDAATADLDLSLMLDKMRDNLDGYLPIGAVLCSCNGRGENLFGTAHHDASAIARKLGPLPLAGLFCSGEIGPVGRTPHLHGHTASLALIVRRNGWRTP